MIQNQTIYSLKRKPARSITTNLCRLPILLQMQNSNFMQFLAFLTIRFIIIRQSSQSFDPRLDIRILSFDRQQFNQRSWYSYARKIGQCQTVTDQIFPVIQESLDKSKCLQSSVTVLFRNFDCFLQRYFKHNRTESRKQRTAIEMQELIDFCSCDEIFRIQFIIFTEFLV